jgi:hypothetical protein
MRAIATRLLAFDRRSGFFVLKNWNFCVRMRPTGPAPMSPKDLTTSHPSQVFAADVLVVHFEKFLQRHDLQTRRQHHGQLRPLPQDAGNRDT